MRSLRLRSTLWILGPAMLWLEIGCGPASEPSTGGDTDSPIPVPSSENGRPGREAPPSAIDPAPPMPESPLFTDITETSGLQFRHFNDASEKRLLPETMGAGVAFFDFDQDGLPDLFLVNGSHLGPETAGRRPTSALYRNLGEGRFLDVTGGSGLEESFYGMGAAVGDFDNDGLPDLFVTAVEGGRLFRNRGGGRFEDASRLLQPALEGFGSSAAFFDYNRDGFLDLFVGRYVQWSPAGDVPCSPDGVHRTYCTPEVYPGLSNRLYRNHAGNRFDDVTRESGIGAYVGKALGVVVLDQNQDGWPDLAIANDTVRNFLLINQQDGRFVELGIEKGMAYSESGATRGGMGIDAGDANGDGNLDIVIGNFSQEMSAFYRGNEPGYFIDDAAQVGLGLPTLMTLAFGTLLEDIDGDGWLDILIANGHIEPDISRTQSSQTYAQFPQFFRNHGPGRFEKVEGVAGGALQSALVARGLAGADIDGDGDIDFVITQNGREARLLRNDHPRQSWIRLQFQGTRSNRTGYGTRVRVVTPGLIVERQLVSGRSYLSACEPVLTIGLGSASRIERIEVRWPSGTRQTLEHPPLNQRLTLRERED